ncbi:MAG: FAD-dependent oxidoreductase [Candidatus Omnitrophota bacterium]|jgi:NAD(P)H-nitrite reductase large subunit
MKNKQKKYVIVGNSTAGVAAIEAIRSIDRAGVITVVSDEPYLNYSRPLISYFLAGKVSKDKLSFRGKDFYESNEIRLILDTKAVRIDTEKKELVCSGNKKVPFDKLLLAAGGVPIIPPLNGRDLAGVFTFTKLSDAEAIEKYVRSHSVKKAVVIGGGLIGLKATEALVALHMSVTIVELADRVLSAAFDKTASSIIEHALEKVNCRVSVNNTVEEIEGRAGEVKGVIFKNKEKVPADLVIIAIGVRPSISLAQGTRIKINKGFLVDDHMRTSVRDIYAAGDCCEAWDALLGINRTLAIWPLAVKQGLAAGYAMVGSDKKYAGGFAMNSVELCGIPTVSVGVTNPEGTGYEVLESYDKEKPLYRKIILQNNRIMGAIFVGDIDRAGIYTGLIRDTVDTASFKEHLLKDDFGLIRFPKEYRKYLIDKETVAI